MQTDPGFTESNCRPRHDLADVGTPTTASRLSGPLPGLVGSAFVSGVSYGLFEFLQRSPVRQEHVAGTAAWVPHLAVALAATVIVSVALARHRRRLARALGLGGATPRPIRLVLGLPAAALFLFCAWGAGIQAAWLLDRILSA